VMGFCTEEGAKKFLDLCSQWERTIVQSGIILIKYWFEVSQKGANAQISFAGP